MKSLSILLAASLCLSVHAEEVRRDISLDTVTTKLGMVEASCQREGQKPKALWPEKWGPFQSYLAPKAIQSVADLQAVLASAPNQPAELGVFKRFVEQDGWLIAGIQLGQTESIMTGLGVRKGGTILYHFGAW